MVAAFFLLTRKPETAIVMGPITFPMTVGTATSARVAKYVFGLAFLSAAPMTVVGFPREMGMEAS